MKFILSLLFLLLAFNAQAVEVPPALADLVSIGSIEGMTKDGENCRVEISHSSLSYSIQMLVDTDEGLEIGKFTIGLGSELTELSSSPEEYVSASSLKDRDTILDDKLKQQVHLQYNQYGELSSVLLSETSMGRIFFKTRFYKICLFII